LRETDRLKDQFLANMSHELRTPLNAVLGFAQLLKGGVIKPDSPKFAGYLGQIASSGQHLLQLIDSLLDQAKAASGQLGFQLRAVDLGEAVHEAVAMLEAKCEQRGVIVDAHVQPTLGPALADPLRLRQVLLNLVGNAVKFSQKGGRVTVRAMQGEGTWARVEVEDAGIGIAAGDLPRLFTAFTQLSEGNTKSHDGTGIGLALVRRIVEAQGGEVGVSSSPGEGSTFHFTLPLVDGRQLAP
jgi:signal transduction histidine kinase